MPRNVSAFELSARMNSEPLDCCAPAAVQVVGSVAAAGLVGAVVGAGEADDVVDHRPGVGPEAQRPAHRHPALAVAHDGDLPARHRVHRADRVGQVLAADLDVGLVRVARTGLVGGAVRDALLLEEGLVVPGEVLVGVDARRRHEQHRSALGPGDVVAALEALLQLVLVHPQLRPGPVQRREGVRRCRRRHHGDQQQRHRRRGHDQLHPACRRALVHTLKPNGPSQPAAPVQGRSVLKPAA